jgi:hypothetical protein
VGGGLGVGAGVRGRMGMPFVSVIVMVASLSLRDGVGGGEMVVDFDADRVTERVCVTVSVRVLVGGGVTVLVTERDVVVEFDSVIVTVTVCIPVALFGAVRVTLDTVCEAATVSERVPIRDELLENDPVWDAVGVRRMVHHERVRDNEGVWDADSDTVFVGSTVCDAVGHLVGVGSVFVAVYVGVGALDGEAVRVLVGGGVTVTDWDGVVEVVADPVGGGDIVAD